MLTTSTRRTSLPAWDMKWDHIFNSSNIECLYIHVISVLYPGLQGPGKTSLSNGSRLHCLKASNPTQVCQVTSFFWLWLPLLRSLVRCHKISSNQWAGIWGGHCLTLEWPEPSSRHLSNGNKSASTVHVRTCTCHVPLSFVYIIVSTQEPLDSKTSSASTWLQITYHTLRSQLFFPKSASDHTSY